MKTDVREMLLLEGSHGPGEVGSLYTLQKATDDSLLEPLEGTRSAKTLTLVQ